MPKHDKPIPPTVNSFADLQLLMRISERQSLQDLVGMKIAFKVQTKDD